MAFDRLKMDQNRGGDWSGLAQPEFADLSGDQILFRRVIFGFRQSVIDTKLITLRKSLVQLQCQRIVIGITD